MKREVAIVSTVAVLAATYALCVPFMLEGEVQAAYGLVGAIAALCLLVVLEVNTRRQR
jgi:uncharacterized membrane protein